MIDDDNVDILISVRTKKSGSKYSKIIEVNRKEWESLDKLQRDELCRKEIFNMIDWGYEANNVG